MSEGNTQTVTCAICKQSCEGKPHATDAKGRVVCRDCIDKKRAARTATDTGGKDVMGALLSKSKMANATPCPSCKSYMPQGTVICTHCGYNTETGKAATTRVIAAPKEKGAKAAGGGMSLSFNPMWGVWAMVLLLSGLTVGIFAVPTLLIPYYAIVYVYTTVLYIWVAVSAFLDQRTGWGIILLIPLLHLFTGAYYMGTQSHRSALKGHFFMSLLFAILAPLLASSFLDQAEASLNAAAAPPAAVQPMWASEG